MTGQKLLLESTSKLPQSHYRDRVYIIKDILLKLIEYGELNQTALISFCGLNLSKHRSITEEMEADALIRRQVEIWGKTRSVSYISASPKGLEFFREILEHMKRCFLDEYLDVV